MTRQNFQARYESSILSTRSVRLAGISRKTAGKYFSAAHRFAHKPWVSTILWALVFVGVLLAWDDTAHAKYDPAPRHVVAAGFSKLAPPKGTTERRAWIICRIFGRNRCVAALNIAWCESGLNERSRGPRDEYGNPRRGIWQFGTWERGRFGYGRNAWTQTRAAKRYHGIAWWSPWQCEPRP